MATGLIIGRCDAAWRPDRYDLVGGPEDDAGPDDLRHRCRELRQRLRQADDPRHQVLLLRRLADHRTALHALDPEWARVELFTSDTAEHPAVVVPVVDAGSVPDRGAVDGRAAAPDGGSGEAGSRGEGARGRSVSNVRAEEATPDWAGPAGERPLTLRFLVEGAPGAGTTTIVEQMATHFEAELAGTPVGSDDLVVHFLDFSAGSFEGRPIRFEVCSADGPTGRAVRRYLRTLVDSVILVVEATPDGVVAGRDRLAELLADGSGRKPLDRADLTVFAHKGDLVGALAADDVARHLELGDEVKVVSTTWERRGSSHGLALATSSALRRLQRRDAEDRPRTVGLSATGFHTLVRGGLPTATPTAATVAGSSTEATPNGEAPGTTVVVGSAPPHVETIAAERSGVVASTTEDLADSEPSLAGSDHRPGTDTLRGAAGPRPPTEEPTGPTAIDPIGDDAGAPAGAGPVAGADPVAGAGPDGPAPAEREPVGEPDVAPGPEVADDQTRVSIRARPFPIRAAEVAAAVGPDLSGHLPPRTRPADRTPDLPVGRDAGPVARTAEVPAGAIPAWDGSAAPTSHGSARAVHDHVDPDPDPAGPTLHGSAIPGPPVARSGPTDRSATQPPDPDPDTVNLRVVTRRRPGATVGLVGPPAAAPGEDDTIRLEEEPVRSINGRPPAAAVGQGDRRRDPVVRPPTDPAVDRSLRRSALRRLLDALRG